MNKNVYATLLSTPSYAIGVIALYWNLKEVKSKYPFVCFCSKCIDDATIKILSEVGIECVRLNDEINIPSRTQMESHSMNTFDKLLLWGATEYNKMVFLDSDMLVVSNIDELFDYKNFAACAAGNLIHNDWTRLNSGLLVIEPSERIKEDLVEIINGELFLSWENRSIGDQDIINMYIPNWFEKKELVLSEGYNMFYKNIGIYKKLYGYSFDNSEKQIKIVHFVGKEKPWHHNMIYTTFFCIKEFFTNRYTVGSYIHYYRLLLRVKRVCCK
mgnify:FL=1